MEDKDDFIGAKNKFLNLILDNGVSLSITVAFCFALYFILHQHNEMLKSRIYELINEKQDLVNQLLECYKYNKE